MIIYHGTSDKYLNKILKEGITPRKGSGNWKLQSREGFVYLTNAYAIHFAGAACRTKKEKPLIIKLKLTSADIKKLYPDEDFMGQIIHRRVGGDLIEITNSINIERYQEFWKDSLDGMGNVCLKGTIQPSRILEYKILERNDKAILMSDPSISIENYAICGLYYRRLNEYVFGDLKTAPNLTDCIVENLNLKTELRIRK